jgi:hypothetical protein
VIAMIIANISECFQYPRHCSDLAKYKLGMNIAETLFLFTVFTSKMFSREITKMEI